VLAGTNVLVARVDVDLLHLLVDVFVGVMRLLPQEKLFINLLVIFADDFAFIFHSCKLDRFLVFSARI
jgi:hypothetical protein